MKTSLRFSILGKDAVVHRLAGFPGGNMTFDESQKTEVVIKVGKQYTKDTFLKILHHELTEASHYILGSAYECVNVNRQESPRFIFDHINLTTSADATLLAYEYIKERI